MHLYLNTTLTFSNYRTCGKKTSMNSALFQPLTIRGITLKNRIAVSPMCMYSGTDGFASDWHLVHLGSRAVGGAGLIIAEATAVSPEGRITADDLGIWKDEHIIFLKQITQFIELQGTVPGIQLAHAGRKASHISPWKKNANAVLKENEGGWQTVAPSAMSFKENDPLPVAMNIEAIDKVISDFKAAAKRAFNAGFKIIEIHAAHGYLINSFLSPLSNVRNDAYGGSFENRIRLLLQIVAAIRTEWHSSFPLFVRISATDWVDGGWTIEDSTALAMILKSRGVDLIDCSSGGNAYGAKIPVAPKYQADFAAHIKKETGILTAAVGMINTAHEAEGIIREQQADIVLLGRQLLRDPYFPLHAAKELGDDVEWPSQYLRAKY